MNLRKNLKKGEVIFHEGNPSDHAYIIGTGSIEIFENTPGGQKVLGILGDNEIFGEMGLIDGLPRSATAFALEDCQLSVITSKTLHYLIENEPLTLNPLLEVLSQRLRQTTKLLRDKMKTQRDNKLAIPAGKG